MPYYVYRVFSQTEIEHLDTHEKYRDAKTQLKELRAKEARDSGTIIRTIFAKSVMEAERLLTAPRETPIYGDD